MTSELHVVFGAGKVGQPLARLSGVAGGVDGKIVVNPGPTFGRTLLSSLMRSIR
jgi:hypothetical protein